MTDIEKIRFARRKGEAIGEQRGERNGFFLGFVVGVAVTLSSAVLAFIIHPTVGLAVVLLFALVWIKIDAG